MEINENMPPHIRIMFAPPQNLHQLIHTVVGFQQAQDNLIIETVQEEIQKCIQFRARIADAHNHVQQEMDELDRRFQNAQISGRARPSRYGGVYVVD